MESTFVHGDVGDHDVLDDALEGVERVVHLAAAVGVGQSMYEIDRYVRKNTMATATFLERLIATRPLPTRLVVASSMSIYGEGDYQCEEHGEVAPPPRPEPQLAARDWECRCPHCSRPLTSLGTSESKPLIPTSVYAVTKRDHEELCLVTGAAYGIPTVALRFFNVYGPGQALSNPYTGWPRSSPRAYSTVRRRSSSRTVHNRATSSMSTTSFAASCLRSSRKTRSVAP